MTWTTLVGAGALVVESGRVLMIRQRRAYGTHWELPTGYYEPGETLEEAAAREVLEETAVAITVGPLLCTMVWQREYDRRTNVLAFFLGTPQVEGSEPRPQIEEDIEAAAFLRPDDVEGLHPLEQPVVEGWQGDRDLPFHLYADVVVRPDGTQDYRFRP